MKRIAVIGAGAAGCFCTAELRRLRPELRVDVYESGPKPLAKVAITGGGRCNLTNSFEGIRSLAEAYPRGERLMKRSRAFSGHNQVQVAPFLQKNTIETTGAGDTFCGSVLNYVLEHGLHMYTEAELIEMLTFSNAAASLITTKKGALAVMPERKEIEALYLSRK